MILQPGLRGLILFYFYFRVIDHDNGKSYVQFFGEGGGCGLVGNCLGIYLSVQETTETCTRQPTLGQAQDEVSITRPRVCRMQGWVRWHAPGLCLATAVSEETRACLACQIVEYQTSTTLRFARPEPERNAGLHYLDVYLRRSLIGGTQIKIMQCHTTQFHGDTWNSLK